MFVRNNGRLDGEPSFTLIFSRCVHLGCPVQPNGPVDDEQKQTVGEPRRADARARRPASAVPCHGGQYDTEGNRTAGPPVRALDRTEFSILDGILVPGQFFSVAKVEGIGADARGSPRTAASRPACTSTASRRGSTRSRFRGSGGATAEEVARRARSKRRRALPARLARGALGPRRRDQVLPLPQGPARHELVPHARLGDADRVPRPGDHGRRAGDVLQAATPTPPTSRSSTSRTTSRSAGSCAACTAGARASSSSSCSSTWRGCSCSAPTSTRAS